MHITTSVLFATLIPIVFLTLIGLVRVISNAGRDSNRLDRVETDIAAVKHDVWFLIKSITGARSPSEKKHDDENGGGIT